MQYVYVLYSKRDRKFYVGSTADLRRRMAEHTCGNVPSTKSRRPLVLVCYEAYVESSDALRRERYLKSSDGRKELRIRLRKVLERLSLMENGEVAEWLKAAPC